MKYKNKKQFNLYYKMTTLFMVWVVVFVVGGFHIVGRFNILAPMYVMAQDDDELTDEEKEKMEEEKEDAEKEIKKLKKKKDKKEKEKAQYLNEAGAIKNSLSSIIGNINKLEDKIKRAEDELERIKEAIKKQEKAIEENKKTMANIIREINQQNLELRLSMLDNDKGIDHYIYNRDLLQDLQKKILRELDSLKEKKRELAKEQEDANKVQEELNGQRKVLEREHIKKRQLLADKNRKISEQEKEIQKIDRKITALKSAISSFLGKSFNTDDIVEAVKFASKKTGVRKEFLMAMLDKETDLGRFTGGCTYKNTKMRDADKTEFKKICKALGYNYKKKKISCALSYGYGGAMGVAQFMPTTWRGYESRIASRTGNNPPDPWDLGDGIVAMALYLKDKGGDKKSGEFEAAARYYCGGNWQRDVCYNYAKTVKSWAKGGYEEYF